MEVPSRQFYHAGSGAIISISEPHVAKFISAIGVKLVELGIPEGPLPGGDDSWLTVTAAAKLLQGDMPGATMDEARMKISRAIGAGKIRSAGTTGRRRVDPGSGTFADWRLRERDRALDSEEE